MHQHLHGHSWCWLNNMILTGRILKENEKCIKNMLYLFSSDCLLLLTARTVCRHSAILPHVTDQYFREAWHIKVLVDCFNFIFVEQAAERCTWSCLLIFSHSNASLVEWCCLAQKAELWISVCQKQLGKRNGPTERRKCIRILNKIKRLFIEEINCAG